MNEWMAAGLRAAHARRQTIPEWAHPVVTLPRERTSSEIETREGVQAK